MDKKYETIADKIENIKSKKIRTKKEVEDLKRSLSYVVLCFVGLIVLGMVICYLIYLFYFTSDPYYKTLGEYVASPEASPENPTGFLYYIPAIIGVIVSVAAGISLLLVGGYCVDEFFVRRRNNKTLDSMLENMNDKKAK